MKNYPNYLVSLNIAKELKIIGFKSKVYFYYINDKEYRGLYTSRKPENFNKNTTISAAHFFEQGFNAAAVFDEVCDGADFKAVLPGEFGELGHACHGAVVIDDFADNGGGNETAHLG